jgi:hypothetical protein
MTTENRNDKDFDQFITSEGGSVSKTDEAVRDTAQKYLDRLGIKVGSSRRLQIGIMETQGYPTIPKPASRYLGRKRSSSCPRFEYLPSY